MTSAGRRTDPEAGTGDVRASPRPPHALSVGEVLDGLGVDPATGLDEAEVAARCGRHGANRLRSAERQSGREILLRQIASVVLIVMAVAAALAASLVSFAVGQGLRTWQWWRAAR